MTRGRKATSGGAMKNFTIRFSPEDTEWLTKTAEKELRPVSGLVRYIVAQYRKELESKKGAQNQTEGSLHGDVS